MNEALISEIIKMSHVRFSTRKVSPEGIRAFIERMKAAYADEIIDENLLFLRLESAHEVTMSDKILKLDDMCGHEDWLNVSTNRPLKRDFPWKLWADLKDYLVTHNNRNAAMVENLDTVSSEIVSRLEDPIRAGSWDRRGMVMGSVQSGKTANYTAVACKALDAGYKLVVILAGIHNSLRSQTQERLNEELLGYDLDRVQRLTGGERRIGVGTLSSNHQLVNTLTSSNPLGDFNRKIASQAGILPSPTGDPIVLIIKKNVTVLKNLFNWLSTLPIVCRVNGRYMIQGIPVLFIDDECDLASVNTKLPEYDENGKILDEWDPAKTNMMIRKLLNLFEKRAYIGYTATPYANIFIYKDDVHPRYGEDLFPKHFILSLPQPSNYIGPEKLFGLSGDPGKGIETIDPLPLVRDIEDNRESIPDSHKINHSIKQLPKSLLDAIRGFLLVCAARRIRPVGTPHNSMLIHVTRFTAVQRQVHELVTETLRTMVARIQSGSDKLDDFRSLWESDFVLTSNKMKAIGYREAEAIPWESIRKELYGAANYIRVKSFNGTSADVLVYREHEANVRQKNQRGEQVPWNEMGISVIAVGGDKLSRGLTLDGLSISYYLRASRMYDTLMQMGRWFGYRDGYTDLCRIHTTNELATWYSHIALANQELRNELEYMAAINSRPEQFGLKVRSHPGRLAVTSAGKSRAAERISIAFAGTLSQTIVFDPGKSDNNRKALLRLIELIGRDCDHPVDPDKPRYRWDKIDPTLVVGFLQSYLTQDVARKVVDPAKIAEFIELQNKNEELMEWTVVLVSTTAKDAPHTVRIGKYSIGCCKRTPRHVSESLITIGTLTSPSDVGLDLTVDETKKAEEFDQREGGGRADGLPSAAAIRYARPKTRGILLIYLPASNDKEKPEQNYGLEGNEVVAFAVGFPESDTAVTVEYWANAVHPEDMEIT